jgi:hypothetical protein
MSRPSKSMRAIPRLGADPTDGRHYTCGVLDVRVGELWNSYLLISASRALFCSATWHLSF